MNDAVPVGVLHGFRDLSDQLGRLARWQWTATQPIVQAAAVGQFHREVVLPVLLADFVQCDDPRMAEVRDRSGLDVEPADRLGRRQPLAQDHLQSHDAMQRHVPRPIDHPHSAARDLLQQFIIPQRPTRRCGRCLRDRRVLLPTRGR